MAGIVYYLKNSIHREVQGMLVDRSTVIAVRCPWCGSVQFNTVAPFQLSGGSAIDAQCQCGEKLFTLRRTDGGGYRINISCIACDCEHNYRLGYNELWKSNICVLRCLYTQIEVCFMGRMQQVVEAVDRYEKELEGIINELGIEEFLDEELWSESFGYLLDTIERVNFDKDLGQNISDILVKRPKPSK
jgi:hypothetical protein